MTINKYKKSQVDIKSPFQKRSEKNSI